MFGHSKGYVFVFNHEVLQKMCEIFNKNMGCWIIATANPQNPGGGQILISLLTFLAT